MIKWLNLDDLGSYLQVSKATLYKMAQRGLIPGVKLGKSWRFDQAQIDRWLGSQQVEQKLTYPWSEALEEFSENLRQEFKDRFSGLWIYGSWARGEAQPDSDVDLLVVLKNIEIFSEDFKKIIDLAYQATFEKNRAFVFSTTLIDLISFLNDNEPLLLNVRLEGKKAA